jgi:hypothetical protein
MAKDDIKIGFMFDTNIFDAISEDRIDVAKFSLNNKLLKSVKENGGMSIRFEEFYNSKSIKKEFKMDSFVYKKLGQKIHFDINGYGILFWDENNIDDLKFI